MAHEQTATWVDKSVWGDGPWTDEPDRLEWRDDTTGLPCLALRSPMMGAWCGYVAVPPGHPWHGADCCDLELYAAHGGLTFAGPCDPGEGPDQICHVPMPGEPDDVYWIGFDCGHAGDLAPGAEAYCRAHGLPSLAGRHATYKPLDYVKVICTLLAHEVADAGTGVPHTG